MNIKILTIEHKFGDLTIKSNPIKKKGFPYFYECQCKCGKVKIINGAKIRSGNTVSCGCHKFKMLKKSSTTHGLSKHILYSIWQAMKRRCYSKKTACFHLYGGRGINICNEWRLSFEEFFDWCIKNKYKNGLQIDRINNDGNYEPSNCRWVTNYENSLNKRNNINIRYKGTTKCLKQWAEFYNVPYKRVYERIKYQGWDFEKAIFHHKMKSKYN